MARIPITRKQLEAILGNNPETIRKFEDLFTNSLGGTVTRITAGNGLSGGIITDAGTIAVSAAENAVNADYFPLFATTQGTAVNLGTRSTFTFNPFTGLMTAPAMKVSGTAGAGFLLFAAQSSNPVSPAAGVTLVHAATTQGFTRLEQDNEAATNIILGRDSVVIVRNTSGSQINKGSVVYVTGSTGNVPNVALAKADSSTTLPAVYVVLDTIANNNFGQVMRNGILSGFDTSAFASGDRVFVSTTVAGGLTNTRPSGTTNYVQRVGTVLVSGVGNGSIDVAIAPAVLNMETGTNAATWTGKAIVATDNITISNAKYFLGLDSGAVARKIVGISGTDDCYLGPADVSNLAVTYLSAGTTATIRVNGSSGTFTTAATIATTGIWTFAQSVIITDAKNIGLGSTTGTQIGTATTQKMGFYGATPIVQRSGAAQAAVSTTAATNAAPFGYTTAAQANAIVTLVNELRAWAVSQGFIKGSA